MYDERVCRTTVNSVVLRERLCPVVKRCRETTSLLSLSPRARAASGASRGGDLGTLDGRSLVARGTRDAVREAELASRLSVWVSPGDAPPLCSLSVSRARVTVREYEHTCLLSSLVYYTSSPLRYLCPMDHE